MARLGFILTIVALYGGGELRGADEVGRAKVKRPVSMQVMDECLAHAVAGNDEEARKLTNPDESVFRQIPMIRDLDGYKELRFIRAYANDEEALSVSSPIKVDGQTVYLTAHAKNAEGKWRVIDIDSRTHDELLTEVGKFVLQKSNISVVREKQDPNDTLH